MRVTTEVTRNLATFGRLLLQPTFTCSQKARVKHHSQLLKILNLSTVFLLNRRSVAPLLVLRCKLVLCPVPYVYAIRHKYHISTLMYAAQCVNPPNNATNILPYQLESPNLTTIYITNHWFLSWLTSNVPLSTLVSSISLILSPTPITVLQQKWIHTLSPQS